MADCTCEQHTVIIALDIGTTYSCAAARSEQACLRHGVHEVIGPKLVRKHPTILMPADDGGFAYMRTSSDHNSDNELRLFKLYMALPHDVQAFRDYAADVHSINQALDRCGRESPTRMFADYAKGLYDQATQLFDGHILDDTTMRLVVTIPPKFAETAQLRTNLDRVSESLRAETGLEVVFMYEHEAAVRGALAEDSIILGPQVRGAAEVMVADVGGATIDSAVYSLKDFHNLAQPRGRCELRGTLRLDAEFLRNLQRKFVAIDPVMAQPNGNIAPAVDPRLLNDWESFKRDFSQDAAPGRYWTFRDRVRNIQARFEREEMEAMFLDFGRSVGRLLRHWWNQFKEEGRSPEVLFITGGIAQSPFFQKGVKNIIKVMPKAEKGKCFKLHFGSKGIECDTAWNVVGKGGTWVGKSAEDLFRHATSRPPH